MRAASVFLFVGIGVLLFSFSRRDSYKDDVTYSQDRVDVLLDELGADNGLHFMPGLDP